MCALVALESASAFRFIGEESDKTGSVGGEVGLFNSIPRMGKRMMGNPFDSRFRFRFNNW